jgi:hypothetical protein
MSNDYFAHENLDSFTTARAADVNAIGQAVEAAFDLLPSPAIMRRRNIDTVAAGGSADTITVTSGYSIPAYVLGQQVSFVASADNTGPVTINLDGLGAKQVVSADGSPLAAGDILDGRIYELRYDGAAFQMLAGSGGSGGSEATEAAIAAAAAASASATAAQGYAAAAQGSAATAAGYVGSLDASVAAAEAAEAGALAAQAAAEAAADAAEGALDGSNYIRKTGGGAQNIDNALDVDGTLSQNGTPVSLAGHTHAISDVLGLQDALDDVSVTNAAVNAAIAADPAATLDALGIESGGSGTPTTEADIRAGTGDGYITPELMSAAAAYVPLADAATIAVNWAAFENAQATLTANRVLGNPTNGFPGERTILLKGNTTTARTLTFGANWKGQLPTLNKISSTTWYLLKVEWVDTDHFSVVSAVQVSGPTFPMVSMTAATVGSIGTGYARSGSSIATAWGASGGTLSGSLLAGTTTDAVMYTSGNGLIYLAGNQLTALAGASGIVVNGTTLPFDSPPTLESGNTKIFITPMTFTAGLTYTLQFA